MLFFYSSIHNSNVIVSDPEFVSGLDNIMTFHSDRFYYCCLLEESPTLQECLPSADEFSSCTDLIRSFLQKVIIWIMAISALSGNTIVIILRLKKRPKGSKTRGSNAQPILTMNLAIADLLMGCYLLMIAIADITNRGRYGLFSEIWQTSFFCRLAGFLSTISSLASIIFLTIISVDRYHSVLYPLSPRRLGERATIIICICVWMTMILVGALPAVFFDGDYYGRSSVCLALPITAARPSGWLFSFIIVIILNLILSLIILVCYTGIFIIATNSVKFTMSLRKSEQQLKEEQLQIAFKVMFLVGSDFFCWMPIIIMGFLSLTPSAVAGNVYAWAAIIILPINSAVNPYLYTLIIERARMKEAQVKSQDTDNSLQAAPALQSLQLPATSGTRQIEQEESGIGKTVLSLMRSSRVLAASTTERYKKYQLSTPKASYQLPLTNEDKEDIIADIRKALNHLHDAGIVHGNISEENVIIDEMPHGNKRAYLLMSQEPNTEAVINQGCDVSDLNGIELQNFKNRDTGFKEDIKQLESFSLRLRGTGYCL